MKSQYDKKPIPVGEQIDLLESKGMEFYDRAFASHMLSIIGYYRFAGIGVAVDDFKGKNRLVLLGVSETE